MTTPSLTVEQILKENRIASEYPKQDREFIRLMVRKDWWDNGESLHERRLTGTAEYAYYYAVALVDAGAPTHVINIEPTWNKKTEIWEYTLFADRNS